jgi:hypothetical protein
MVWTRGLAVYLQTGISKLRMYSYLHHASTFNWAPTSCALMWDLRSSRKWCHVALWFGYQNYGGLCCLQLEGKDDTLHGLQTTLWWPKGKSMYRRSICQIHGLAHDEPGVLSAHCIRDE